MISELGIGATSLVAFPKEDQLVVDGKIPIGARSTVQWMTSQSERLMDTGVWIDDDMGISVVLQEACERFMGKFGWVASQGKPACADSASWLVNWGRSTGNERSKQDVV